MLISDTRIDDLDNLVNCHKSAFPKSLSSLLGEKYIKKMLEWYITSNRGVIFHIKKDNFIVGYCAGVITNFKNQLGASSSINQYTFNYILMSLLTKPWLLFHQDIKKKIPYILKAILIKFKITNKGVGSKYNKKAIFEPYLGLISIGVNSNYQGQGYGSTLLDEFESRAIKKYQVNKIILSVNNNNHQAIKSYLNNNWQVESVGKLNQTLIKKI